VLWYASSDSLYGDDFKKSNKHSLRKHILQRHFNDVSEIKPFKQPIVQVGAAGRAPSWPGVQVCIALWAESWCRGARGEGWRHGQPPWPLSRDTYTLVDVTNTPVTSPHSRGLRHNHAWHGGERGTPLPVLTTSPPAHRCWSQTTSYWCETPTPKLCRCISGQRLWLHPEVT